jgi:hypothetical protein
MPVESWNSPDEARLKYADTPGWDAADILAQLAADPELRERMAGRSWHVGGGEWLTACGHCDAYAVTWGVVPSWSNLGPHMVAEHGAQVAGINVGILA